MRDFTLSLITFALFPLACSDTGADVDTGVAETSTGASATEPTGDPTSAPTEATSGTDTSAGTNTDTMTGTTMSSTEATQTSTGPSGCVASLQCGDPAAPVCVDTVCVSCTAAADGDAECAAKDPGTPACRDDGQCVQCTPGNPSACADETPVCDGPASACVGCSFHEQCSAGACDIASGACFDGDCAVEVDGDGGADYASVSEAIGDIADGCVVTVHEAAGGYPESVVIDGGMLVALLAADGEEPIIAGVVGNGLPAFDISGSAVVYIQGLRVNGNDAGGIGVDVSGASVWLDRTQVVGNQGGGLVLASGAYASVRNSFIGGDVNDIAAIDATSASLDVLYTTVGAGFGAAAALRCNAASTVNVRNSLLVARTDDPEVDCLTDSLDTSATEGGLGDMNTNWFTAFAAGDFGLSGNIPVAVLSAAQWNVGDPPVDIDGDARPDVDGTADVAGADLP